MNSGTVQRTAVKSSEVVTEPIGVFDFTFVEFSKGVKC
jgi:hypothetical protein